MLLPIAILKLFSGTLFALPPANSADWLLLLVMIGVPILLSCQRRLPKAAATSLSWLALAGMGLPMLGFAIFYAGSLFAVITYYASNQ